MLMKKSLPTPKRMTTARGGAMYPLVERAEVRMSDRMERGGGDEDVRDGDEDVEQVVRLDARAVPLLGRLDLGCDAVHGGRREVVSNDEAVVREADLDGVSGGG
jgi:hypothetical protein